MNTIEFPNPKLNLPKELLGNNKKESFNQIDNYLDLVKQYIYTDIYLKYESNDPNRIHAWIQKLISASLIRSLYLRNNFVEEFNNRNIVAMYLPLKALVEIVAFLASIKNLLESKITDIEISERLLPYALGNRGKGSLRVGTIEAISVISMIEKADKYMGEMNKELSSYFTDIYDIASNPSHPSFDANELVGRVKETNTWKAFETNQNEVELIESLPGYGVLLLFPISIKHICEQIFELELIHFNKLNSKKFFN